MSTLNVNTINAATSGQGVAVDVQNPRSFRNLIINGAMNVAQRGTSSTTNGYGSVDRFAIENSGVDEAPTHAQVDVASGTTPYTLGFRKALKITNGNQTGGADAGDFINFSQAIEAQNIAQSGWNYTSTSSFITLSFWIKSSVAQDFKGYLSMEDGTERSYPYATGSLTANTWTKITKTIPGASNLQADNNSNKGFYFSLWPFIGTNYTSSSVTEDAWMTYAGGTRTKDATSTWYTTNDATLEITGVQLEVGSYATDFEHRSYNEELARCQRYYFRMDSDDGTNSMFCLGWASSSTDFQTFVKFPITMRDTPSAIEQTGTASHYRVNAGHGTTNCSGVPTFASATKYSASFSSVTSGMTTGQTGYYRSNNSSAFLAWSAEL